MTIIISPAIPIFTSVMFKKYDLQCFLSRREFFNNYNKKPVYFIYIILRENLYEKNTDWNKFMSPGK